MFPILLSITKTFPICLYFFAFLLSHVILSFRLYDYIHRVSDTREITTRIPSLNLVCLLLSMMSIVICHLIWIYFVHYYLSFIHYSPLHLYLLSTILDYISIFYSLLFVSHFCITLVNICIADYFVHSSRRSAITSIVVFHLTLITLIVPYLCSCLLSFVQQDTRLSLHVHPANVWRRMQQRRILFMRTFADCSWAKPCVTVEVQSMALRKMRISKGLIFFGSRVILNRPLFRYVCFFFNHRAWQSVLCICFNCFKTVLTCVSIYKFVLTGQSHCRSCALVCCRSWY